MDMRTLSLSRRFEGILAWDSFFHLSPEDQRPMFSIFRTHAASKAALIFTSGPSHGEAIGTYQDEPSYQGSLDEAEYRLLLNEMDLMSRLTSSRTPHRRPSYDRACTTRLSPLVVETDKLQPRQSPPRRLVGRFASIPCPL